MTYPRGMAQVRREFRFYRVTVLNEHDRPKRYRVETCYGPLKAVAIAALVHASRYPHWYLYRVDVEDLGAEAPEKLDGVEEPGLYDDRMEW
jgi:hypothetical protein